MKNRDLALFLSVAAGAAAVSNNSADAAIAMGAPVSVNVALNQPTFGDTAFGAPTSRGNDGIDGNANSGNWTHADYPTSATPYPGEVGNAPNPYWEVDLSGSYHLDNIVITDRVGCCDPSRLDGSLVTLLGAGGSVIGTQVLNGVLPSGGQTLTFDNGGLGFGGVQRIRIDGANGGTPIQFFQFSEFGAFATIQTPINWALGASAQYYDAGGSPVATWPNQGVENITDGNTGNQSHPNDPTPHTGFYVDVDLGMEILIDSLDLVGRSGCCDPNRLTDPIIEIFDSGFNLTQTINATGELSGSNLFSAGDVTGQYIRITNGNGANYGPEIAELMVYGVIPEPSTALLSLLGGAMLLRRRR